MDVLHEQDDELTLILLLCFVLLSETPCRSALANVFAIMTCLVCLVCLASLNSDARTESNNLFVRLRVVFALFAFAIYGAAAVRRGARWCAAVRGGAPWCVSGAVWFTLVGFCVVVRFAARSRFGLSALACRLA